MVQQCATEIYLPNPKADFHEYTDGFKLTPTEFSIVKELGEESRTFLIKQGHQSMLGKLDMGGGLFDDELAILSGSTDNLELLETAMQRVGDDPTNWLPVFHELRKARIQAAKSKGV